MPTLTPTNQSYNVLNRTNFKKTLLNQKNLHSLGLNMKETCLLANISFYYLCWNIQERILFVQENVKHQALCPDVLICP